MRYGILSDIHGNLEALHAVLSLLSGDGIDAFLCAGDIVGYGADPGECLKAVSGLRMTCVAGNHDWAVAGRIDPVCFNPVAKKAVLWTQDSLSAGELDHLGALDLIVKFDDLILVHGTLGEPEQFHYLVYLSRAKEMFQLMDRNICFIGHTHAPQIIVQEGDGERIVDAQKAVIEEGRKYIVNVGSVGQPRDGDPTAAYCIYDTKRRTVEIRRTPYDIEAAQEKIRRAGLPDSLARRLAVGH